jgi:hypothetical protein
VAQARMQEIGHGTGSRCRSLRILPSMRPATLMHPEELA